ncbi:MAG: LysR substrate-binding domain-containing protein [Terriglobia bacterium]|jgi:LysR family hydrogen peroxide-inducible transcriptional activator
MEIHQLRYFLAVARFQSFTRAAEHEHVAQPSLSQQIRKLKHELGAPLIDRMGRRIRLTALGERFLEHTRRVLIDLEGARQDVDEMLGLARGHMAVGVIPTIAPFLLPQALARFARDFPTISISVREDLTHSLLAQLAEGEIDLAILSLPVKGPEFVAETLLPDRMLLAVSPRHHLWRKRQPVTLRDLTREPFLLLKEGHCFRDDVLQVCNVSRLNPHVVFEGGQFDTLVGMVAAGAGVTLLPEMSRRHYRHAGVRLLEFLEPQPTRTIGVVKAKDKFQTEAARAFLSVLREARAK